MGRRELENAFHELGVYEQGDVICVRNPDHIEIPHDTFHTRHVIPCHDIVGTEGAGFAVIRTLVLQPEGPQPVSNLSATPTPWRTPGE